jgi:anti-sigma regulatory factor (Ser/Thr protein kinase)
MSQTGDIGMREIPQKMQFTVPCSANHLGSIRKAVRHMLDGSHVSGKTAREIVVGVDEAVTEVMLRSYVVDIVRDVDLEIALDDEKVRVSITNDGACFDPQTSAFRGGFPSLGIELIREVFDDISHSYADHGMNHLVLTRNLAQAAEN